MKRRSIIGGNWKCNPETLETVQQLSTAFNEVEAPGLAKVDVIVFPSAIHVCAARSILKEGIAVGAQNVSVTDCGAFTGELSAKMARSVGCQWVLVGHSERRAKFGETFQDTVAKVGKIQESGLGVVFCVGELLEEREAGRTIEVCASQLSPVLPKVANWQSFVIAYEPVWAIGTGVVATKEQAQEAHQAIRELVREQVGEEAANTVRIQYGGSVTPENCAGLIQQPDIDGFLVGGASLKPTFTKIIDNVVSCCE
mmetsp:Transcript_15036/g.33102  ORF Transcript_15036/g.33102 Transcript_15036/m.33102 type:complete len:255 (+) Transcript_15036:73-837(+)|eukprot:CAMPEP_0170601164 /NCGR_PEP_ID=MMETSP0224-20130122/17714_1 /TAXON_ID=285029 /ORGANISM="Togula jolla, Strain CCCM 725" /LENGTH=254 /DNA_ID=CAMNT_0010925923 /DNA_START=71 /DNA_END=835 /DNA_ORIENTATION=-